MPRDSCSHMCDNIFIYNNNVIKSLFAQFFLVFIISPPNVYTFAPITPDPDAPNKCIIAKRA